MVQEEARRLAEEQVARATEEATRQAQKQEQEAQGKIESMRQEMKRLHGDLEQRDKENVILTQLVADLSELRNANYENKREEQAESGDEKTTSEVAGANKSGLMETIKEMRSQLQVLQHDEWNIHRKKA